MLRRLLKRAAGERAFAAADHAEAGRLFAEMTRLVPAFAEAWFWRALACNRQNHQFDACRHGASAARAEPPAGAVFCTVVNSIAASIGSLDHPVFLRYEQPRDPARPA